MLMTIRDKAQGWIAWAIVILISIPFALWGIQEYLGVGSEPVIAKVNDREITESEVESGALRMRNNIRQQLGAQYNADMFPESMLRKQVLEGIVRDTLLQQAAEKLGLRAGDMMVQQTIVNIPAFQVSGQFSVEAYQRGVQLQGLSEKGFEERIRSSLVTTQLQQSIQNSSFVTKAYAKDAEVLANQQRRIEYVRISSSDLAEVAKPTEEQIEAYYKKNSLSFMSQEQVKLEYLLLNLDTIASTLKASDDDLQAFYEQHKSEFVVPDKKRVSHILLEIADDANQESIAETTAKAVEIIASLSKGESFAELAKKYSADIASAESGGDLGYLEPGVFDKAFEEAASQLKLNEISEPVRTRFGLHLIKITEVQKGSDEGFAAVKKEVENRYLKTEAEQIFFDYAERLGNLAYETPDSLIPASEDIKLPLQKSDWITRAGGEGVLSSPKVTGAAFSEEALTQGFNSEMIELSPNELIVLRVVDHRAPALKPLDDVKDDIIKQLSRQTMLAAIDAKADDMLTALNKGEGLGAVASAQNLKVEQPGFIGRAGASIDQALVDAAFSLASPQAGKMTYTKASLGDDVAVVALYEVKPGETSEQNAQLLAMLAQQQGGDEYKLYIESLREKADIEYFKEF